MTETGAQDPREAEVSAAAQLLTAVPAQALARLRVLAAQGSVRAMRHLARAYQQGVGSSFPPDLEEAGQWYRALLPNDPAAALAGFTEIAQRYVSRREFSRARATLLSGLDAGVPPPPDLLAQIDWEEDWALEPDVARFRRATAAWSAADFPPALQEFRFLADFGSPLSMTMLGWAYRSGRGVPVDWSLATAWLRRAQETGRRRAPFCLGLFFLEQGDYRQAVETLIQGAELDEPAALYVLGVVYRRGIGVVKTPEKARALFERAKVLGNLLAKRDLALLLLFGRGGLHQRVRGCVSLAQAISEVWAALQKDGDDWRVQGQLGRFFRIQMWIRHSRCRRTG